MSRASSNIRHVSAAQRGQIIQRVLVDGWSPAQAAAVYGIAERHAARWVAAYRRHGMASLRDEGAADGAARRWLRRLRAFFARMLSALHGELETRPASCIVLRRGEDGPDPRSRPDRRSIWN